MIYGRQQLQENTGLLWDYVACLYPEGNFGDDYNVFFQHQEVEQANYAGYSSPAEQEMQQILNQV